MTGVSISGYAAYWKEMAPADVLARAAARGSYEADMAFSTEDKAAERKLRAAIELNVDAFLADRQGNARCFTRAHRIGRLVEQAFGCVWQLTDNGSAFVNKCGVLALHGRLGASPGGVARTACSICGAAAFECDHIEGEVYDGGRCIHMITDWLIDEISLTPNPHDPRTYRITTPVTLEEAAARKGAPLDPGERPACMHCSECVGFPNADDLDTSLW